MADPTHLLQKITLQTLTKPLICLAVTVLRSW